MWGASTSAYQVEGGFDADNKGLSVQDVRKVPEGTTNFNVASDHYHRYEEDIALFKELGLQSYRFSISWARIFPKGKGEINPKGVEFYHKIIDKLIESGIEPIITVYHFDLPYELHKNGGWSNRETIDDFVNYCKFLFKEYGSNVKYWLTINEQNMMTMFGRLLSGNQKSYKTIYQENHHMFVAQAMAIKHYRDQSYPGVIGVAPNIASIYAASDRPEDQRSARYFSAFRNWLYLDAAVYGTYNHQVIDILNSLDAAPEVSDEDLKIMKEGTCDYIAINYYNTITIREFTYEASLIEGHQQSGQAIPGFFDSSVNNHLQKTKSGWDIDPQGFTTTLHEVYSRYRLPIMITENGLGTPDVLTDDFKVHDDYRIDYLKKHISSVKKAIDEGVQVIAYNPWSAIDLVSTHEGIQKRYGFIYVNRDDSDLKDLKRYKKDSFYWYQKFIKEQ